jgi:hypothetical protein
VKKQSRESQELFFDPKNANKGTRRGRQMVAQSLEQLGAGRSIVVDRHNHAIAGNKTLEAARSLNMPTRIVESDGKTLIVVKRTDLDLRKDSKARRLAVADNRTSEVGLNWDPDVLADIGKTDDLSILFTEDEFRKLTAGADVRDNSDAYPEMEIQPFEHFDYIVVTFRNSMDFLSACERFGIKKVAFKFSTVDKKKSGSKIGLGRCIDGAKLMERLWGNPKRTKKSTS